jgi:beta-glucanase (GH16 family)
MHLINSKKLRKLLIAAGIFAVISTSPHSFAQTIDLRHYTMTFNQDFSTAQTLSVSDHGPITPGGTTWIAHTPYNGDWVHFEAPSGPFHPFAIGNGYLTIRAQAINGVYYGGLLSSVDANGNGFAQKYGYFEMNAKLPPGPGTWPAFWLMSLPGLLNRSLHMGEIDIVEQYGDPVATLFSTLHLWDPSNSWAKLWHQESLSPQPTMTTGFHTYGADIQPDYITFYYDRQRIGQMPNAVPGYTDKFDQPMYIMVDLAYGGGYSGNIVSNLLKGPQDMQVRYVRVWQGSGGSKGTSTGTSNLNSISYASAGLTLAQGSHVDIRGVSLSFSNSGKLAITDSAGNILWQTDKSVQCGGTCRAVFQNDGNLVLSGPSNKPYWTSHTWNNNVGSMTFSNHAPYLEIMDGNAKILWTTGVTNQIPIPGSSAPLSGR